MSNDEIEKHDLKKKQQQMILNESPKLGLFPQSPNPLNPKFEVNQVAQFNYKDEKKKQFKKLAKVKKIVIKRIRIKFDMPI
jgi:hypothetical protein